MPFHLEPTAEPKVTARSITRRDFLGGLTAASAALLPRTGRAAADEAKDAPWFALLSDTHIAADPAQKNRGQNMADNMRRAIDDVLAQPGKPRGLFVDGDLALRDGQLDDYRTFLKLLEPVRGAKIPIHLALGNHDDRSHVREVVRGAVAESLPAPKEPPADRYVSMFEASGLRFVVLDSLDAVNGTPGRLGQAQLDWLAATLDAAPATETLIFVHHNPSKLPSALLDTEKLLEVLKPRHQTKAVFFGHTHVWNIQQDDGLHLVNLPAVAYPFSDQQPLGWVALRPQSDHRLQLRLHCIGGNRKNDRAEIELKFRST